SPTGQSRSARAWRCLPAALPQHDGEIPDRPKVLEFVRIENVPQGCDRTIHDIQAKNGEHLVVGVERPQPWLAVDLDEPEPDAHLRSLPRAAHEEARVQRRT